MQMAFLYFSLAANSLFLLNQDIIINIQICMSQIYIINVAIFFQSRIWHETHFLCFSLATIALLSNHGIIINIQICIRVELIYQSGHFLLNQNMA